MTTNDSGYQQPEAGEDKTSVNNEDVTFTDAELEDVDEGLQNKFKSMNAQKSHWKDKASKLQEEIEALKKAQEDKTSQNEPEPSKSTKQEGLDYGQKAYLASVHDIKDVGEVAYLESVMKETGRSLEEVASSKYVQAEIKEMREKQEADNAVPKGSERSGGQAQSTVEYWLNKGELPENTPENRDLRRKVVNARMGKGSSANNFTSNPVVG